MLKSQVKLCLPEKHVLHKFELREPDTEEFFEISGCHVDWMPRKYYPATCRAPWTLDGVDDEIAHRMP